jgi:DNA-binding NarL/FixJ family response regulator
MHVSKVRVLVADDHQAILTRVRRELGEEFEIVGTAETGQEAVDAVSRFDPDVLVMDISMPGLNGLEAASHLRGSCCRTKIIFLTIHDDPDFIAAAFSAGASGYVTKNRLSLDLVLAIREALLGKTFTSQTLKIGLSPP